MSEKGKTDEISTVSESQWQEAHRYLPVIQQLVNSAHRTRAEVISAARELKASAAQVMALLGLLGMHPMGAFPIMMGSCALLQPVACLRFFESGRFAFGASLGRTLGGLVGVLIALFIVKSLPLHMLRWLVVIIVSYAAFTMLRSRRRKEE